MSSLPLLISQYWLRHNQSNSTSRPRESRTDLWDIRNRISFTIYEMVAIEIFMTLIWPLERAMVKCSYAKAKAHAWLFSVMEIMIAQCASINKMLAIEMCVTMTWTLQWAKVKCKYVSRRPAIYDFLLDGNSSISSVCHRLRDIRILNIIVKCLTLRTKVTVRKEKNGTYAIRLQIFESQHTLNQRVTDRHAQHEYRLQENRKSRFA